MENKKFIIVEEDKKNVNPSLEKSNEEKLDILTKMIQEVEEKIESDDTIKRLIK